MFYEMRHKINTGHVIPLQQTGHTKYKPCVAGCNSLMKLKQYTAFRLVNEFSGEAT